MLDRSMRALNVKLEPILTEGVVKAARASAGDHIDDSEVQRLIERHKSDNSQVLATAMIPFIFSKLTPDIARGLARDPAALKASFDAVRSLPPQYAGNFWVMIFDTQKVLGQTREMERRREGLKPEPIKWVLDPRAEHCRSEGGYYGCPDLAKEYESWNALPTVPAGMVTCRGNCVLPETVIELTSIEAAFRAYYSGLAIKFITESGISFSVTANHPVLTPKGWLRAQFIDEGDYVVKSTFGKSPVVPINNNHQNMPALIEQIWDSLAMVSGIYASPLPPIMPDDFHGDGGTMHGDVDIILPYRTLWGNISDTSFNQSSDNAFLHKRLLAQRLLPSERTGMQVGIATLPSPDSGVVSRDLLSPLLSGHFRPLQLFGFTLSPQGNSLSYESVGDSLTAYTQIDRQLQEAFARQVTLDKIIKVIKFDYSGHVYDLQTDVGYYLLNSSLEQNAGIINSNCRCHLEVYRDGKWQRGVYE